MNEIHECDCCAILDKIMVIEGSTNIIELKFSKDMDKDLLEHFERIQRSINVIYEHVRKNQKLKKPVEIHPIVH